MEKINKILLEIEKQEKERGRQIEKVWASLSDEDWFYMENIENFKIWK